MPLVLYEIDLKPLVISIEPLLISALETLSVKTALRIEIIFKVFGHYALQMRARAFQIVVGDVGIQMMGNMEAIVKHEEIDDRSEITIGRRHNGAVEIVVFFTEEDRIFVGVMHERYR